MHVGDRLRLDITNMHEKSIGYSFCPECKNEWPEKQKESKGKRLEMAPFRLALPAHPTFCRSDVSMVVCEFPYARRFDADMQ